MGYVEPNAGGWTELRVHGVAGTPPEAVLQHPHTREVAGNRDAGFFRRWWEAASVSADTLRRRREAYSWGGLTSGDNIRALWLLLLPFMLLNVAFYMTPYRRPPTSDDRRERRRDRVSSGVQRVLALSFTVTFTLTAVAVAMDLVGWKCTASPGACGVSWLGWLDAPWWHDRPGRQAAVAALVPLAVVGLLWWLAGATWDRLERVRPPASETGSGVVDVRTPLEDRAMWNGRGPVRRLRAVHVSTGLVLPGVFALAPVPPGTAGRWPVLVALLAFLVAMLVTVAHPAIGHRDRPTGGTAAKEERDERRSAFRFLPWCGLGLTVGALAVAAAAPVAVAGPTVRGTLPWLANALYGLFAGQALLLALVLGACLRLLRARRRAAAPADPAGLPDPRPAWRGLAMPAIALLAWVLAGGFSAGVVLRAAETLGTPVAPGYTGTDPTALVVPVAYRWVAAAAFALAVAAALAAVVVAVRLRRSAHLADEVAAAYGPAAADDADRAREIARAWSRATALTDELRRTLGLLLAVTAVVALLGGASFAFVGSTWVIDDRLVAAGNAVLSAFVLALLGVGRQAYRNPAQRRTVGIVWDLGTFWPRAVHPLAPPCYAERAVPDLIGRLQYLTGTGTDDDGVLLSCHSQGTVLGAVVLMQVETATSARTAFLTYGSPLVRLYRRFFPAYFSREALERLGGFVGAAESDPATWRWRNLYRPSDPIGGPVLVAPVDRLLLDPVFARAPGDPCYPPIRGHSDYFADPAFAAESATLEAMLPGSRGGDHVARTG